MKEVTLVKQMVVNSYKLWPGKGILAVQLSDLIVEGPL